jgi:hypothetical protein
MIRKSARIRSRLREISNSGDLRAERQAVNPVTFSRPIQIQISVAAYLWMWQQTAVNHLLEPFLSFSSNQFCCQKICNGPPNRTCKIWIWCIQLPFRVCQEPLGLVCRDRCSLTPAARIKPGLCRTSSFFIKPYGETGILAGVSFGLVTLIFLSDKSLYWS